MRQVRVAPAPLPAVSPSEDESVWMYELRPPRPLPTLDLSLSMKSRFLSRRALRSLNKFVARKREIGIAGGVGLLAYMAAVVACVRVGGYLAILAALLWTPATIAAFSLLRVDVVVLLLGTFDFWFSTFTNIATYSVLGSMMGDVRVVAAVAACFGMQANVMIDANLRAVKLWTLFNIVGILDQSVTLASASFIPVDRMRDFAILRHKSKELSAQAVVTSGLTTSIALIARNLYRTRSVFQRNTNHSVIECATYRTNLRFAPLRASSCTRTSTPCIRDLQQPEYVKTMRHVQKVGIIDARCTLVRAAFAATSKAPSWFSSAMRWLGIAAVLCSVASVFFDVYVQPRIAPAIHVPSGQLLALMLTSAYCGTFALHHQRKLLVALCTHFDFVFLWVQLAVVHGSVCDFFDWSRNTLVVLISWIWTHWLMSLDAVPPITRRKLGLQKSFTVAVLLVLISSGAALMHILVFADSAASIPDRVLWESTMLGHHVQFRVQPIFFNCFATAFVLTLRLLWRQVHYPSDVLLVLDGPIVYENYLRKAKCRVSRRWGSFAQVVPTPSV